MGVVPFPCSQLSDMTRTTISATWPAWEYVKTPTALADVFLDIYAAEDQSLVSYGTRLKTAFLNKISLMSSKVDLLEARIQGADPRKILSRGYVLVLDGDGVVLKSASGRKAGDNVSVMFADGRLDCEVKTTTRENN